MAVGFVMDFRAFTGACLCAGAVRSGADFLPGGTFRGEACFGAAFLAAFFAGRATFFAILLARFVLFFAAFLRAAVVTSFCGVRAMVVLF